jgi:hypothetical protein
LAVLYAAGGGVGDLKLSSMWSAGKEGPTAQVLPELKLQDLQAQQDYDAALKTINSSKTLNDTEKLAQSRELKANFNGLADRLLGVAILLIVAALFSLVRRG